MLLIILNRLIRRDPCRPSGHAQCVGRDSRRSHARTGAPGRHVRCSQLTATFLQIDPQASALTPALPNGCDLHSGDEPHMAKDQRWRSRCRTFRDHRRRGIDQALFAIVTIAQPVRRTCDVGLGVADVRWTAVRSDRTPCESSLITDGARASPESRLLRLRSSRRR